jgi:uncharacterized membrane protein (UPF0127 family)
LRKIVIVVGLICATFVSVFLSIANAAENNFCTLYFDNVYKISKLPVADTAETQAKGLSKREDIGNGMIFVWGTPRVVSFWMKDTIVPLSIGFFDKNKRLFQIEDMEVLSLDRHISSDEILAALELKKGDFDKQNITIGTKITKLDCE